MSGEPTIPATAAGRALIEATARWANARTRAVYPEGDAPLAVPHWSDVDAFGREVLEPAILAIEAEARAEARAEPDETTVERVADGFMDWRYGSAPFALRERERTKALDLARTLLATPPKDAPMTEPRTKAGRALLAQMERRHERMLSVGYRDSDKLEWADIVGDEGVRLVREALPLIEAEARAEPAAPDTRALAEWSDQHEMHKLRSWSNGVERWLVCDTCGTDRGRREG